MSGAWGETGLKMVSYQFSLNVPGMKNLSGVFINSALCVKVFAQRNKNKLHSEKTESFQKECAQNLT